MTSAHWDLVYGRPPISRDAILFGIAVVLHLPLLLIQFKAPIKSKTVAESVTVFDMRDQAINQILERGMLLPPKVPGTGKVKSVDLSRFIRSPSSSLPPVPLPKLPPLDPGIKSPLPTIIPPKIAAGVGDPLRTEGPVSSSGEVGKVKDKGKFYADANMVRSLESASGAPLPLSQPKTILIPTAPTAQAESGIHAPAPLTGKIHFPSAPSADSLVPKSAIKVDKHAGSPIAVRDPVEGDPEENLPVIRARPRTLTAEQRTQELFPIHGALKDRGVDRQEIPEYPEWARKKGIESSVKFKFSVTADGRVKENIEIVQGSGYPELDELARTALLRWVFSRLPPEKGNIVQDGAIEFRFSIK
ncbi:MAG: energy transducer TonB [Elusimicrobia bacterium]|nr:energy transducer TonB [Elusimicrobiota bacterium]